MPIIIEHGLGFLRRSTTRLESGEICGNAVSEAYEKKKLRETALIKYQRLWDAINRKPYSRGVEKASKTFLGRNQEDWADSVRFQASLSPHEMIAIIRYNRWLGSGSNLYSRGWHDIRNLIRRLK